MVRFKTVAALLAVLLAGLTAQTRIANRRQHRTVLKGPVFEDTVDHTGER